MRKRLISGLTVLTMLLLVAVAYNPASAATYEVGVKVGDTADYNANISSLGTVAYHFSVHSIVGTTVTLNSTYMYLNGTLIVTGLKSGDIANNPGNVFLSLISKNLTVNDPVWQGSGMVINNTETMLAAGASRAVVHAKHAFTLGQIIYSGEIWWDQATGITVKTLVKEVVFFPDFISEWYNLTLTSTSLWSSGDQFGLNTTTLIVIAAVGIVAIIAVALLARRREK